MPMTWILVADAAEARIYSYERGKGGELAQVEAFSHPESRMKGADLIRDRSGNNQSGGGHGTFVEQSETKIVEADRFARELVDALDKSRNGNKFDQLVLVAPPRFYGMMKQHFKAPLQAMVTGVVEKNYLSLKPRELQQQLIKNDVDLGQLRAEAGV